MNRRLALILVVAMLVAVLCGVVTYRLLIKTISAGGSAKTTKVVAAATDLKLGAVLNNINLTTIDVATSQVPKNAILKPEDAVGRGVVQDMYAGEMILESRLAPKGSGGGLAATIPQGMRVTAVKVDDVVGVAGFATPGMHVDVIIAGVPPGEAISSAAGTESRTILQNLQVMSAGQDIAHDAEGKPHTVQVVNLLVTPEQAQALSLANAQERIQLVLRNPLDQTIAQVPGTATSNLFADPNAPPKQKPVVVAKPTVKREAPQTYNVEVINGSKHSEEKFNYPEGKQ